MTLNFEDLRVPLDMTLAVLGGAAVGSNRQRTHHPAGFRTMMLVSLGAAAFVAAGRTLSGGDASFVGSNASRVLQGLVGGIGFLGAGTIIQAGRQVKGVTTAAAIWVTAAIGAAFGLGLYVLGGTAVVLTMLILWLSPVEAAVFKSNGNDPVDDEDCGKRGGDVMV